MSINDEIRASQKKLQAEMQEAERKRRMEERMENWRAATGLYDSLSPRLTAPPAELLGILSETLPMAKYNSGKIVSTAPDGYTYARQIKTTNNSRESATMYSFDVILESKGSGKDLKEYGIWFFKNGNICFVYNSQRTNLETLKRMGYTPTIIRQKIIDAIALQGMDSKGNIKHTPGGTTSNKSDGCYIATAVYGSYDCPQVWTLRRFRDYKLKKSPFGRSFIKAYYFISPKLVKHCGHNNLFINFWRKYLDKKIIKLNNRGYSQDRYIDE